MDKGIIYYTDNRNLKPPIIEVVKSLIEKSGLPIVSCSLKPISFGKNIVLNLERSYPTMVEQIITALEALETRYVFFCEHDVLYHHSHFEFTPYHEDLFFYNLNNWRWDYPSDRAVFYYGITSLSQMCCNRELALSHYKKRRDKIKKQGLDKIISREPKWVRKMGYEPGTKSIRRGGITDEGSKTWRSDFPNIDIRHSLTFSPPKVKLESFKHLPQGWVEKPVTSVEGWNLKELFCLN